MRRLLPILLFYTFTSTTCSAQDLYILNYRSGGDHPLSLCEGDPVVEIIPEQILQDSSTCILIRSEACYEERDVAYLTNLARDRRVLIMIHGMAKDWDAATKDFFNIYHNVSREMAGNYDVFIAVSWPGDQTLGPGPYLRANTSSKKTGVKVREQLTALSTVSKSMDVITHSMGSRVLAKALKNTDIEINNALLLAPSILKKQFKPLHRWNHLPDRVGGHLVICHSTGDWAFNWTNLQHAGMGYQGAKVGNPKKYAGITQIDCSAVINQDMYRRQPFQPFKSRSNHSYYCQNQAVFRALAEVISQDVSPAAIKLVLDASGNVGPTQ